VSVHDRGRVEVLILRGWIEHGQPDGLRVRIVRIVQGRPEVTGIVTTADDAVAALRAWLADLSGSGSGPPR
jgi:hypothetical protein